MSEPSTPTPETPLAAAFPAPTRADWLGLVGEVLKGDDFEKRLLSRTADGLIIRPLTTRAERVGRGVPWASRDGRWDIRQHHAEPDAGTANAAILEDLAGGAGSLLLQIVAPGQAGIGYGRAALEQALGGVPLNACAVALDARENTLDAAGSLIAMWRDAGMSEGGCGFFNLDPLGVLAKSGTLYYPAERACAIAARFAGDCHGMPRVRVLLADGRPYHEAGASEAQELAAVLATFVAYLRACEREGQTVSAAFAKIAVGLAADADLFLTLAKLRAARGLILRVAEACGAKQAADTLHIAATTSERMLARRDPWVNILRAAVACAAAALGGADAITVLPFTWALGKPDAFARRIARNTQLILQEESALSHVRDPAAGSYSLEAMTETLATAAWTLFQEIEAGGGMARALESGFLQRAIGKVAAARATEIAHGRASLTGVSAFALLGDDGIAVAPHPPAAPIVKGGTEVEALPLRRLAEPFERLRDRADAHLARTGKRPRVFVAALGAAASNSARATWIGNFLAAGGIEAVSSGDLDGAEAAVRAFAASGAEVACICASDRTYAELGEATASALRSAGARRVLLAGRPKVLEAALTAAGVDQFIAAGGDAPLTLAALHGALGVAP
jgi:methylmalonyl-CoA mutase